MRVLKLLLSAVLFSVLSLMLINDVQAQFTLKERPASFYFEQLTWEKEKLADGVTYYSTQSETYLRSNQIFHYIEIEAQKANLQPMLVNLDKRLATVEELAKVYGATIAMNGSFYDYDKADELNWYVVNGYLRSHTSRALPTYLDQAALSFNSLMDFTIVRKPDSGWYLDGFVDNMLSSGPLLVYNSSKVRIQDVPFNAQRDNRSAIGIRANGDIILLVVDGRLPKADGLTVAEVRDLMYELGCARALNLDGGGAVSLVVSKNDSLHTLNYPSDNGLMDHQGLRLVRNAIVFKPIPIPPKENEDEQISRIND